MLLDPKWQLREDAALVAGYIREHGWVQNIAQLGEAVCLRTAMKAIPHYDRRQRLAEAMGFLSYGGDVIEWNDAPGRTVEEVLARLEAVGS
jgi:hypothetical protein